MGDHPTDGPALCLTIVVDHVADSSLTSPVVAALTQLPVKIEVTVCYTIERGPQPDGDAIVTTVDRALIVRQTYHWITDPSPNIVVLDPNPGFETTRTMILSGVKGTIDATLTPTQQAWAITAAAVGSCVFPTDHGPIARRLIA